jgi:hypothetical protein
MKHWCTGQTFLPEKVKDAKLTCFERKLKVYTLCVHRVDEDDPKTVERVPLARKQIFKLSSPTEYLNHQRKTVSPPELKFYAPVAQGEPYGEFDRDTKVEIVRQSNITEAKKHNPNHDKVWCTLGLPNRKRDLELEEMRLRISDRVMNIEEVKSVVQDEMINFTAEMSTEFEVAMADIVAKTVTGIVEGAVEEIRQSRVKSSRTKEAIVDVPDGYKLTRGGIISPHTLVA